MIDWKIETKNQIYQEDGWYFPSFIIQEYLLPLINVGYAYIDEYNDTKFSLADCKRFRGNIKHLLDYQYYGQKEIIRYDSFSNGLVNIRSQKTVDRLANLDTALVYAIKHNSKFIFYGD